MRSDSEIKHDVEEELRWDPDIDPTDIAVAVKDGVVTLTGFVRNYINLRRNVLPSACKGSSEWQTILRCACRTGTRDPTLKSHARPSQTSRAGCRVLGSTLRQSSRTAG